MLICNLAIDWFAKASAYLVLNVLFPTDLLWALMGLILTIGGTFLEASVTNAPWNWTQQGLQPHPLGVSFQVGAVLFVSCVGGRNAAVMAQIAYLLLGLLNWLEVFTYGGGLGYVFRPSFGYILGFVPGAWICGYLAFRMVPRLEALALSCLSGLIAIHLTGISYLMVGNRIFSWIDLQPATLLSTVLTYSLYPLPGQLVVICAVTVLAYIFRQVMFY